MGHPMRLELTLSGLLVNLTNHYTTWGTQLTLVCIWKGLIFGLINVLVQMYEKEPVLYIKVFLSVQEKNYIL